MVVETETKILGEKCERLFRVGVVLLELVLGYFLERTVGEPDGEPDFLIGKMRRAVPIDFLAVLLHRFSPTIAAIGNAK